MQINNKSNLSFGTNIKVVSPRCFRRIANKMEKCADCEIIQDFDITNSSVLGYRENINLGITGSIRSCSAGVIAKKGKNAKLFWHIFDSLENIEAFPILEKKLQGDNAILIGAKSAFFESVELNKKFQEALHKKSIPTTILCDIAFRRQAFIAYTSKEDTLYLSVCHCDYPFKYVKSMKNLKKVFSTIKISPKDNIEFIGFIKGLFLTKNIKF